MANTYLHRTLGSTVTVTKITISCWVKRSSLGSTQRVFSHMIQNFAQYFYFRFDNEDTLGFASANTGNYNINFKTNRKFRDTNAWYHLVAKIDTTASSGNRVKLYVNGVQETSLAVSSEPDQNSTFQIGTTSDPMVIGGLYGNGYGISGGSTTEHFDGSMSHFHFCDGYDYDASEFGSTDSTTGEWKINTSPSVTYGTNGFFILKDGNSVTDQSGNSNNFTASGTLTKTEDCPSNVFPTINPLTLSATKWNLEYGNLRTNGLASGESQGWRGVYGTLGALNGKYYFEMKVTRTYSSDTNNFIVGIVDAEQMKYAGDNGEFTNASRAYGYRGKEGNKVNNTTGSGSSYGNSYTTNDIVGIAMDLDNSKLYFSKNGTWQNSGDPTSGSTGTGSAYDLATGYTYLPAVSHYYDDDRIEFNFGNGYFGTTAVSSAGTNASNNGIFEYDVPSGYTALSTKGLNI